MPRSLAFVLLLLAASNPVAANAPPACASSSTEFSVRNAVDLAELVLLTNCTNGNFTVSWRNRVVFEEPLVVGNSTTLSITGDEDGAILDGGGATRLIVAAEGTTISLENLVLRNASAPSWTGGGGAILSDGAQLILEATSCIFADNYSPVEGGVVLSTGGAATVEFTSCEFEGNTATSSGGAIRVDSPSALTIRNTTFFNNTVEEQSGLGGAVSVVGGVPEVLVDACDFRSNRAQGQGGALYYSAGGDVTITDTNVEENWAMYGGGGMYCTGTVKQVNVQRCTFQNNTVYVMENWGTSLYEGGGMAVYGESEVTVLQSLFVGNGAENGAGVVLRGNHTVLFNTSTFESNVANTYAGAVVLSTSGGGSFDASFIDCDFTGNRCAGYGGAIAVARGPVNVTLLRTNFVSNSAAYIEDLSPSAVTGGAYYASGDDTYTFAHDCVFERNVAGSRGGAVALLGSNFSCTDCDFVENEASGYGGGIYAAGHDDDEGGAATVSLRGGTVRNNSAAHYWCTSSIEYCGFGGAVRLQDSARAILYKISLEENVADFGGAVSISSNARVSASGIEFSSNTATVGGGAVHVWGAGSHALVEDGFLVGNVAGDVVSDDSLSSSSSSGPSPTAITTSSSGTASGASTDSSYSGPTRDSAGATGGGISASGGGTILLTDTALYNSSAEGRGGAMFCSGAANVTVRGVEFEGHRSGLGGSVDAHGGAFAAASDCEVRLEDVTFVDNEALGASGGALSAENGSHVTASRCTFPGNQASGGGAVFATGLQTRVSLDSCTLEENRAYKEGGALRGYSLLFLQIEGSDFLDNSAGEFGGAVHCYECSTVTASNCVFAGNYADGDGGAVRLSYATEANFNRCRFLMNEAVYDGGAVAVDAASGESETAELSAAALYQNSSDESSAVSLVCCNTTFDGNLAGERGGSLYSTMDSSVELRDCNSTGNSASLGGSLYLSGTDYLLNRALFLGDFNTVPVDATIFAVASTVRASEVTFADTSNTSGMLAFFAGSGTTLQAQECVFVGWTGSNVVLADSTGSLVLDSCDFTESTAEVLVAVDDGENVELAVVRNARIGARSYEAIAFSENALTATADNSSTFGLNLVGCDADPCTDGCEEGDLGVYCACYETILDFTVTCLGRLGNLELNATETVVSEKYPDDPQTQLLLYNNETNALGPVLWTLDWTDDPSSVVWTVLPSTGLAYPGELITIYLHGEVASNWNGQSRTVMTAEAPHQEDVDISSVTVNVTFVYCTQGEYWHGTENTCVSCASLDLHPEGVDCTSEGTLLETLPLLDGYWRANATTTIIRECFNDDACLGNSAGLRIVAADDYCADGYEGPYCAVCTDGYTVGVSHTCHSCGSSFRAGMVVIMALTGVIMVVGIVIVINDLTGNPALTDLSDTPFFAISRRLRLIPFHKLKIPLVVFQIMTQYASITSIEFPAVFQTFLSSISVINLDLGWLFRAVCLVDVNFHGRLLAATVGPFAVLLVLFGTYIYTCKQHGLRRPARETPDQAMYPVQGFRSSPRSSESEAEYSVLRRVQDKHVTVALTIAFLLYSTVSTVIFETFTCDYVEDMGQSYLRADYEIDCDSDRHRAFKIYAGAMMVVYPIGIPVAFFVLLFRKRRFINPPKEVGSSDALNANEEPGGPLSSRSSDPRLLDRRIAQTSFLWRAYRPGAYYFEVLECFRRLLLTGCLVFILPNSSGQAAVACVLAVITVAIFAFVHPFEDPDDHRAYTIGAMAVFLTMFMGLVVRVDLADEEEQSQRVLAALLIVLTVGLLVVAVAECLWEARRLSRVGGSGDDDRHVFLRPRETKSKDQLADEKYKMGGSLYAPKLQDVPGDVAFRGKHASKGESIEDENAFTAAGGGAAGGRKRGSQMFMQSTSSDPNYRPHVAIVGTSSNLHPSEVGSGSGSMIPPPFPSYRGPGTLGIDFGRAIRSSSGSHSPHSDRRTQGQETGGAGGLVPAEFESVFDMDASGAPSSTGGRGNSGSGRQRSRKSSKKRRSSSKGGMMRPAMPAAGPTDEMRPSPDPAAARPPGPWVS